MQVSTPAASGARVLHEGEVAERQGLQAADADEAADVATRLFDGLLLLHEVPERDRSGAEEEHLYYLQRIHYKLRYALSDYLNQ